MTTEIKNRKNPETEKPAPRETSAQELSMLDAHIKTYYEQKVQEKTGETIDFEALKKNPDPNNLDSAIQKLFVAFQEIGKKFEEKISSILTLFGIKNGDEYISASPREPAGASLDTRDLQPEAGKEKREKLSHKTWDHLQNAEIAFSRNKSWREFIQKASTDHGIPEATVISIIEMESNFDPRKKPIDPVTRQPDLRVTGLAQARPAAITEYQKAGHPNADLMDPQTAIDFVAWYSAKLIHDVNWMIQRDQEKTGEGKQNWKTGYALSEHDSENLWLAYNQGAEGYLRLKRYTDPANTAGEKEKWREALSGPQKRTRDGTFECEHAISYAQQVGSLASAYEALHNTKDVTLLYHPLVGGFSTTSGIGVRSHPVGHKEHLHNGVDLAAEIGTRVVAVKGGRVVIAESKAQEYNGRYVAIEHNDGSKTMYLHLDSVSVITGQQVNAGQMLGTVGQTGRTTGPHLHFIYKDNNGNYKNPFEALTKAPKIA